MLDLYPKIRQLRPTGWQWAWLGIYCCNLCLPLALGSYFTEHGGRWGMMAAILLIWLIGHIACGPANNHGSVLLAGGIAVGLSQFTLGLHIFVGMLCIKFAEAIGLGLPVASINGYPGFTEFGGFLVTLLTAAPFLLLTVVVGEVITVLADWMSRRPTE